MKINVIDGKRGCEEIDIDISYNAIDGVTSNKKTRILYLNNKKRYRLTLASYKELVKEMKIKGIYNKLAV